MSFTFAFALYWVIWWTILFVFLPIGVRSQHEAGDVVPGSEGAAPARPLLLYKALLTTVTAFVILGLCWLVLDKHIISLDQIPFGPRFDS